MDSLKGAAIDAAKDFAKDTAQNAIESKLGGLKLGQASGLLNGASFDGAMD
jgi:hypothetical protein